VGSLKNVERIGEDVGVECRVWFAQDIAVKGDRTVAAGTCEELFYFLPSRLLTLSSFFRLRVFRNNHLHDFYTSPLELHELKVLRTVSLHFGRAVEGGGRG
jgi:hypothetical protein